MRIKVTGGTARSDEPSLCLTCRFATVVKGVSLRDGIIECSQLSYGRNRVTFPVTQCTEYSDPKKNTIGFVKRTELTRRERFVLDDDEFPRDAV
jgi:hypothetical protein